MRDAEGQKYAEMVHAHQTLKNRHGGIPEKKSHESLDHSTVLNRRDRRFVLVPVEICTETQPATASSYPTTVAESQRMGYDRVREQPSHAERIHWQQLMIKEISFDHSVMRATTIMLWPNAKVPSRHITSVSGHANEQTICKVEELLFIATHL